MAYKLLGQDFTPPDVVAKVTGQAKYAEDFRIEGMVFARLLVSPLPHARVLSIDTSEALQMPGVVGVLLPEDVTNAPGAGAPVLTLEPQYIGAPILAIAAESETAAHDALEKVKIEYERLPFTLDPLQSLRPDGPNARTDGNVVASGVELQTIKWTQEDFDHAAREGKLPMGKPAQEWTVGDLDAAFAKCKVIYDETFVTASNSHHSLEPRTTLAHWQNGKCFVYGSTQSQSYVVPTLAQSIGITPAELVYIAEFCGGGFGSKGGSYPSMAVAALLAKKINRPVMLRISRAEEYYYGSARNGFQGQVKVGFDENGRMLAADIYIVQENGAYESFWDFRNAADALSLVYQPEAMRWRGIPVCTNSPLRTAQRGPGYNQLPLIVEPLLDRAARELGIDRVAIRLINAPQNGSTFGPQATRVTSAYLKEALEQGAAQFNWQEKLKLSGRREGSKVTGVAVGTAFHPAGFTGFDGLVRITPDGKLHIHTGVGNLGTFSHSGTARIAAEVLKYDWNDCIVERGDTRKHLPWNIGQFGSNTSFTMGRTNYVAALDALNKLKDIAAKQLGGTPDDYDIDGKRVFHKGNPRRGLTYAQAAQRAIELGGKYSGHELPADINAMTQASASALAGSGLIGVAKDTLPVDGQPAAFAAAFIQIELDVETGQHRIIDYLAVADCGTVIHPMGLATQIKGGAVQGFGLAAFEQIIYDPQNGLPASVGLYQAKPPSFMDTAVNMDWGAVNSPDPHGALGTKGIGEPLMGCAAAALLCAISDAMGGHVFNRTPVKPDMIINHFAGRDPSHRPLQVNTQ